jgi:NAD(P)H-dependent flavin oxidoreductase YrpB (nitropropane dioxygenase family)
VPNAEREARWRATLAPYYEEFGIDATTVPAAPGRAPFNSGLADVLSDFRPAVVSFHFGLPSADLLARVRALGSKILASATTVEEARWLQAQGVDAIIAQGLESGGLRSRSMPSASRLARHLCHARKRRRVPCIAPHSNSHLPLIPHSRIYIRVGLRVE